MLKQLISQFTSNLTKFKKKLVILNALAYIKLKQENILVMKGQASNVRDTRHVMWESNFPGEIKVAHELKTFHFMFPILDNKPRV